MLKINYLIPLGATTQIVCLLILAVILVSLFLNYNKSNNNDRLLAAMVFITMFRSVLYLACSFVKGKTDPASIWLNKIFIGLIGTSCFLCGLLTRYIENLVPPEKRFDRTTTRYVITLSHVVVFLFLFSIVFPIMCTIYNTGHYQDLLGGLMLAIVFFCSFGFDILQVYECIDIIGKREVINVLLYISPMAISLVLNSLTSSYGLHEPDFLTIGLTTSLLFGYTNIHSKRRRILAERQQCMTESKVSAMMCQIQPHFIYNALGTIQYLYETDDPNASTTMDNFCKYLRGNFDFLGVRKMVSFKIDKKQVDYFVSIEKERFKNIGLKYDLEIEDFDIPFFTLQPLVENAIRYGIRKRENGGTVTISTREKKKDIIIIVSDDGVGFDLKTYNKGDRVHVGLANVKERLELMCDGTIDIKSEIGVGTTITITIPKEGGLR